MAKAVGHRTAKRGQNNVTPNSRHRRIPSRGLADWRFGPRAEALDDPRMVRLFNQRALGAATQAKRLAQEARNFLWQEQAEEVERRCRQALGQ